MSTNTNADETPDPWTDESESLLDLIAHLDIIERLVAVWYWLCGIRSYRFSFLRRGDWRGIDVERLLRRHGVRLWDRDFDRRDHYFRVKIQQARWAEYLMVTQGVPLTSAWFYPPHENYSLRENEPPAQGPPLKAPWEERLLEFLFFLD